MPSSAHAPTIDKQDLFPHQLAPEAFHGLAGKVVTLVSAHCETGAAAILLEFLILVGHVVGHARYFKVGPHLHYFSIYAVFVKGSQKTRRADSSEWLDILMQTAFILMQSACRVPRKATDISTPLDLVARIQDACGESQPQPDHLLVMPQNSAIVQVLSPLLLQASDGKPLQVVHKGGKAYCAQPHISMIADTSDPEGNYPHYQLIADRILWSGNTRSQFLPEGGDIPEEELEVLASEIAAVLDLTESLSEIKRDQPAQELWAKLYPDLSAGRPGRVGEILSRAEVQVTRLSCVYAILDGTTEVQVEHLLAALAIWDYCAASAVYAFGDLQANPIADRILEALKAGPGELTKTEITKVVFGGNVKATEIDRALIYLMELGLVTREQRQNALAKRKTEVWSLLPGGEDVNFVKVVGRSGGFLGAANAILSP